MKLGHGGTLDPLATGILICGVGLGTKELPKFLACKKTYETVVLFGTATDTYDCLGKVVARAPSQHVTREIVEKAIKDRFLGSIIQQPPIFSAKRIDGKHAYEYAREGKELPRELAKQNMTVDECTILDWYDPGQHDFKAPEEEAPAEEKEALRTVYTEVAAVEEAGADAPRGTKRLADEKDDISAPGHVDRPHQEEDEPFFKKQKPSTETDLVPETNDIAPALEKEIAKMPTEITDNTTIEQTVTTGPSAAGPPAAKVRLTVSSGFYVRSFCHDLGLAVGSMGLMSTLVRSRQGEFILGDIESVLDYSDLEKGEEFWSAKLTRQLQQWPAIREKMGTDTVPDARNLDSDTGRKGKYTSRREPRPDFRGHKAGRRQQRGDSRPQFKQRHWSPERRKRDNTSSPE